MDDKKITPEELKAACKKDVDELLQKVAAAMNSAQPGNIINDSEKPVWQAHAEFSERLYQKAVDLLRDKRLQEDSSASEEPAGPDLEE